MSSRDSWRRGTVTEPQPQPRMGKGVSHGSRLVPGDGELSAAIVGDLLSHWVEVTTKDRLVYEGVLGVESSMENGIVLRPAMLKHGHPQALAGASGVNGKQADCVVVPSANVTHLRKSQSRSNASSRSFATDTEISSTKTKAFGPGRQLKAFDDFVSTKSSAIDRDVATFGDEAVASHKPWNQFEVNEKKFGVKTTYDEHEYTTKIDRSRPDYLDVAAKADQLAAEIQAGESSNPHMREERGRELGEEDGDEEDRFSGVQRSNERSASAGPAPSHRISYAAAAAASAASASSTKHGHAAMRSTPTAKPSSGPGDSAAPASIAKPGARSPPGRLQSRDSVSGPDPSRQGNDAPQASHVRRPIQGRAAPGSSRTTPAERSDKSGTVSNLGAWSEGAPKRLVSEDVNSTAKAKLDKAPESAANGKWKGAAESVPPKEEQGSLSAKAAGQKQGAKEPQPAASLKHNETNQAKDVTAKKADSSDADTTSSRPSNETSKQEPQKQGVNEPSTGAPPSAEDANSKTRRASKSFKFNPNAADFTPSFKPDESNENGSEASATASPNHGYSRAPMGGYESAINQGAPHVMSPANLNEYGMYPQEGVPGMPMPMAVNAGAVHGMNPGAYNAGQYRVGGVHHPYGIPQGMAPVPQAVPHGAALPANYALPTRNGYPMAPSYAPQHAPGAHGRGYAPAPYGMPIAGPGMGVPQAGQMHVMPNNPYVYGHGQPNMGGVQPSMSSGVNYHSGGSGGSRGGGRGRRGGRGGHHRNTHPGHSPGASSRDRDNAGHSSGGPHTGHSSSPAQNQGGADAPRQG